MKKLESQLFAGKKNRAQKKTCKKKKGINKNLLLQEWKIKIKRAKDPVSYTNERSFMLTLRRKI